MNAAWKLAAAPADETGGTAVTGIPCSREVYFVGRGYGIVITFFLF